MAMEHTQPTRSGPHMYFLHLCHVGGPYGTVALCQVALLDAPSDTAAASGVRLRIKSGLQRYRIPQAYNAAASILASHGSPCQTQGYIMPRSWQAAVVAGIVMGGAGFWQGKRRVHAKTCTYTTACRCGTRQSHVARYICWTAAPTQRCNCTPVFRVPLPQT